MAQSGVTSDRQEFFDDSSSALKLDRKASAPDPQIFERGGDKLPAPGKLREIEIGERAKILQVEREKRDTEIAKLIASGQTARQAAETYDRERGKHGRANRALERQERHRKAIEDAMGVNKKPTGHSSSNSGRRRSGKKGTWVCKDCHLEFCGHRPVKSKGPGRPVKDRKHQTHVTASANTKSVLKESGLGASDALEAAAIALQTGCALEDAVQQIKARNKKAAA